MKEHRLVSDPQADLDVEATFQWYENEAPGLGNEFLVELRTVYDQIVDGPLQFQQLRSGIRRALLHRFPYGVFFSLEHDLIVVIGVLHASRDPAEWQRRRD
ncbi:MAG: type II toxin-antitoxin system RelE/ParE family toxin [Candidatus Riflebacteria bacterium]|nr:type II toxin-antitoxin system RelE/ParE family toxin [Candidatus Riflebacteria bacterium]